MKSNPSERRVAPHGPRPERPWQLRVGFWLLLAIALFYLLTEHRAHLATGLQYLPLLLLAACPLIHLFGHRHGHGNHPGASTGDQPPPASGNQSGDMGGNTHRHGGNQP